VAILTPGALVFIIGSKKILFCNLMKNMEAILDNSGVNVLVSIQQKIAYLNAALARIGQYILDQPELCKNITIKDLAVECAVAESSVTRFVREIGFDSYQELKIAIAESLTQPLDPQMNRMYIYEDITKDDSVPSIIEKVFHRNMQILSLSKQTLNVQELRRATDIIDKAGSLVFTCKGSSAIAAEEGVIRFARAGKKCLLFRDESLQLITVSASAPGDAVIGISNSGRSISVVNTLELARERGVPTIGITAFENSPLSKNSDVVLYTPTKQSDGEDGLGWEVTSSKSAQILVIDILYACYAARRYEATRSHLEKSYKAIRHTRH
jgi:DNA-binding MurR/RpiR family transcriptional regulator